MLAATKIGEDSEAKKYPGDEVAQAAWLILMRRGWTVHVSHVSGRCWLEADDTGFGGADVMDWQPGKFARWLRHRFWSDPFVAAVEADKWHKENVDNEKGGA